MKKPWRKPLTLLAALGLLVAACGSDGDESIDSLTISTETQTVEAVAGDQSDTGSEEASVDGEESNDAMADEDGGTDGDGPAAGCASEDLLCIGLVTDAGKIDDKSFNQSAWDGVQQLGIDMGATVAFIETQDSTDYETNIDSFIDQGYDVVVTVGSALGEATGIAAGANPDVYFVGVDQSQVEERANVAGLIFPQDQAAFLAGALAGLLTESDTVAQVLGTDLVPAVVALKEGFENGVAHTNVRAEVISTYHPSGVDVAFADPEWGASTARQALDNGADVIFGAGGLTGNGALAEIATENGSAFCIGVDTDQWETVPEAHPCLVTSAMKLIEPSVVDIVTAWRSGDAPSGNFVGDVGLADYHDFASVIPQDVQTQIAELTPMVLSGDVLTGYAP